MACRALNALVTAGVKAGDSVVAHYDTAPEDIALALAVARLGGTFVPIPKRMGVREINYILSRSAAAYFSHSGDNPPEGVVPPKGAVVRSAVSINRFDPLELPVHPCEPDHTALIGVTSGSTGQPKGVMHSWQAVSWSAERMRSLVDTREGESILVTGAGAGAPGFTFFTYQGLAHGIHLVKSGRWDPVRVLELGDRHGCVWSCMVTTMLEMLLQARPQALGDRRLEAMRAITVGGSYMSADLIRRARSQLGVEVLRMYAMAECMCNASMLLSDSEEEREIFDGRPAAGAELAVFDDAGNPLATSEVGEVGLKGPSLLQGYLGEPEEKARLMTADGFFLSGDVGRITADGFVKIVGRKKDMIIRGGFNIDPSEVEELLKAHPAIAKVAVVGYPAPIFGERACAVVELEKGADFDFDTMVDFLKESGLSREKLPERLECRDAMPLSPDGKILKGELRKEVVKKTASENAVAGQSAE